MRRAQAVAIALLVRKASTSFRVSAFFAQYVPPSQRPPTFSHVRRLLLWIPMRMIERASVFRTTEVASAPMVPSRDIERVALTTATDPSAERICRQRVDHAFKLLPAIRVVRRI